MVGDYKNTTRLIVIIINDVLHLRVYTELLIIPWTIRDKVT